MSAESIINEIGDPKGWNDETKLALCLQYISNQGDDLGFRDFLVQAETPELPTREELENSIDTVEQCLADSMAYANVTDFYTDQVKLAKLKMQLEEGQFRDEDEEEVVNAACSACGGTGLPLHENMQCAECWPEAWVVLNERMKQDGETLYWSNGQGWVDYTSATKFSPEEKAKIHYLPIDGRWVRCSQKLMPATTK